MLDLISNYGIVSTIIKKINQCRYRKGNFQMFTMYKILGVRKMSLVFLKFEQDCSQELVVMCSI